MTNKNNILHVQETSYEVSWVISSLSLLFPRCLSLLKWAVVCSYLKKYVISIVIEKRKEKEKKHTSTGPRHLFECFTCHCYCDCCHTSRYICCHCHVYMFTCICVHCHASTFFFSKFVLCFSPTLRHGVIGMVFLFNPMVFLLTHILVIHNNNNRMVLGDDDDKQKVNERPKRCRERLLGLEFFFFCHNLFFY